jgi:hypothetical protein
VPFAFLDTGYVDLPPKGQDCATSLSFAARCAHDLEQGRTQWGAVIRPNLRLPMLSPLRRPAG